MIKFCKTCLMTNTRPRIVFNKLGVCNACQNAENKNKIDWVKRKKEFNSLINNIKKERKKKKCLLRLCSSLVWRKGLNLYCNET